MRSLLRSFTRLASAIVIVLTFLAYLAPHVNPEKFRGLVFFGTAFPWLLWANVVLLLVWAYRRNRFAFYHLGILILGGFYITRFVGINVGQSEKETARSFTIVTHNLGGMWPYRADEANYEEMAKEYALFLKKNGLPEIICTQETRGQFYKELARELGYAHQFNLKKGTVILSKFPMSGGGEIPFDQTKNSTLWVDVEVNGSPLRVYNVHLQSNKVTAEAGQVLDEGDINKRSTWRQVMQIMHKVGGATKQRAAQARAFREHMHNCPHPVIVCGDFNDTPNSYVYRLMAEGMEDTFHQKGRGLGTTFAGPLPFLRIDYILSEPGMQVEECRVVRARLSDHFPVFSRLSF